MGNGNLIGVLNTTKSGVWGIEDVLLDVNGIRTEVVPRIGEYEKSAWIMGVSSEGGWHRIDVEGNTITVEGSVDQANGKHPYFDNMPIYKDIQSVTVASSRGGQSLVRIPQFWFKREGTGLAGSPYKLWISDQEVEGFKKHPAFALKDHFYVGAYACGGSYYDSIAGLAPKVSITLPTAQSAIVSNHGTGWELWNIYQLAAIQMLFLVEFGDPDAQKLIGAGNSGQSWDGTYRAAPNGKTNAVYRGIHEIWGNVWQMVDGLRGYSGTTEAEIFKTDGSRAFVRTGITPPASNSGSSMLVNAGTGFDLKAVNMYGPVGQAHFADSYGWPVNSFMTLHGGAWYDGSACGVFSLNLHNSVSLLHLTIGSRLAKV